MIIKLKDAFLRLLDISVFEEHSLAKDTVNKARSIPFLFFLISAVLTAWGYFLTHTIICVDCLSGDRYSNGMLLGQNRITGPLISKILGLGSRGYPDAFFGNLLGIILLALGVTIICAVLEKAYKPVSDIPLIVFACLYVSYPLLYEFFTFGGALTTGTCTVLTGISLDLVSSKKGFLKGFFIPSLLLMFSVSYYEAFILPYVTLTSLILILTVRYKDYSQKQVFNAGIKYALPLLFGIILKTNLGFIFQAIFKEEGIFYADKASDWLITGDIHTTLESVKLFFDTFIVSWVAKAFCYTPITIIAVFVLIGVILLIFDTVRYKKPILLLLYGIAYLSVFAFTLYRCDFMACRMEQAFPTFIASLSFLILLNAQSFKKKAFYKTIVVLLTVLTLIQCVSSSQWVHIENARYTEEKQVITNIYNDIRTEFDIKKPVAFIGKYALSENITEKTEMKKGSLSERICTYVYDNDIQINDRSYKVCDKSARSYLSWGVTAFDEPGTEIFKFLKFEGFSLVQCSDSQYDKAVKMHEEIPPYPSKGYIYDAGDYLIVNLG